MHPVIYPFFSVACAVFFMFLFLTDASVKRCLHKPICCNFCMDVQKNYEIYRNKLQSNLLSLFEFVAARQLFKELTTAVTKVTSYDRWW